MLPRGLIIAIIVGVIAGGILGTFFVKIQDDTQLEFVEGSSLSIVTEKIDFELGEDIRIKIVNSGTTILTFSDASYGLKITGLDGRELYSPISSQVISTLKPGEEISFVWSQKKNDNDTVEAGTYKIISSGIDENDKVIKKSVTINIYK